MERKKHNQPEVEQESFARAPLPKGDEIIGIIEQRLGRYMKLYEDFHDQIEIRYTPVTYTTTRQTIYYNEEGPYLASDYRRLLSLNPKEPPYYINTIYLQEDLINHIKENFEAAWANSIKWDQP